MYWLYGHYVGGRGAVGLLVVRLVFGAGIMLHGWQKLNMPGAPFQWMGPNGPPAFLQGLAVLAESGGGIAMILGLLMPLAMFGLTCNMLFALCMVHLKMGHPFIAAGPGKPSFEPAADYLAVALCLLIAGPGCISLDALIFRPLFGKQGEETKT
jgi:putative oxidoreductase